MSNWHPPEIDRNQAFWIGLGIVVLSGVYMVLRAIYVPPYTDEVTTFFDYVRPGDFQPYYARLDANNHVLNSLLSRLSYLAFGGSMFSLRLPNVLSFILYAVYLFRFRRFFRLSSTWLTWIVLMTVPVYLLSFFHLCRGYGISFALLTGALYHCLVYSKTVRPKDLYVGLVFLSLAVWSNLALMITVLVVAGLFSLFFLRDAIQWFNPRVHIPGLLAILVIFCIPAFYAIEYSMHMKETGRLYHGADGNLYLNSIARTIFEMSTSWASAHFVSATVLTTMIRSSVQNIDRLLSDRPRYLVTLIFASNIIGIACMHAFLGVKIPIDRAAVQLYILMILCWLLVLEYLDRRLQLVIMAIVVMIICIPSLASINLRYTPHWAREAVPAEFYHVILKWKRDNGQVPSLSTSHLAYHGMEYYDAINAKELNVQHNSLYPNTHADFIIIQDNPKRSEISMFDTVKYDPNTTVGLLQLREAPPWEIVAQYQVEEFPTNMEFCNLASFRLDSLNISGPFKINASFKATCQQGIKEWWLIYAIDNEIKKLVAYHFSYLHYNYPTLPKEQLIESVFVMDSLPEGSTFIKVFLWNIHKKDIQVHDSKLTVSTLESK